MTRLFTVLGVAIPLLAGCSKGLDRYEVSGTVTYAGKPLPTGYLVFAPDGSKQNKGPGSQADIKDGKYQIPASTGVMGGAYRVTISGADGIPVEVGGVMNPMGKPLFDSYRLELDLPKENSVRDLEIPATAALKR